MITKIQLRSKPNLKSSTPQSKNQPSTISIKFNSWLNRFNLQPRVETEIEKKETFLNPSETLFEPSTPRDSIDTEDKPRPKSRPSRLNPNFSPNKKTSRPIIKQEDVSRAPSQTINKIKLTKPTSACKQEPLAEYTIGNTLGVGAYGTVKYGVHKVTGEKVAIKVYDRAKICNRSQEKCIEAEIKILTKLDHPNIVKLIQRIDTPKFLYIVLEYVSGYSLSASLKRKPNSRLEEFEANKFFQEILMALDYCHSKGITHRDIKLENILLDTTQKRIKLIDFGFATCFSNLKKVKLFCGTPSYMAPEIFTNKEYSGPPVDIWAAGVLLFVLLTGNFPFKGNNDSELFKNILKGHIVYPEYVSTAAKQFISKMLKNDPQSRPKIKDLLKDGWFRSTSAFLSTKVYEARLERVSENPKTVDDGFVKNFKILNSFSSLDLHNCSVNENK